VIWFFVCLNEFADLVFAVSLIIQVFVVHNHAGTENF
jgi:hypothetical protein